MSHQEPLSVRQRPATTQCWEQNSFWLMSFGDLMLLLLCFFVLMTVIDQGSSRLTAATPLNPSSAVPVVSPVEPDVQRASPPEWSTLGNPVFDHELPTPLHQEVDRLSAPALIDETYRATQDEMDHETYSARRRDTAHAADRGVYAYGDVGDGTYGEVKYEAAAPQQNRPLSDETAPPEVVPAESDRIGAERKIEATLREIFRPAGDRVEIQARPGAVTVRLRDTITFHSGSADLLPEVRPLLDRVANLLTTQSEIRVETAGHTDEVPIATTLYPSNWELSAARAAAVARYLLGQAQIDPRRIEIAGYGEHRPVDSRSTVAGRARNRRVEIHFVHPLRSEQDIRS